MSKQVQRAITNRHLRDKEHGVRYGVLGKVSGSRRIYETGRPNYVYVTLDDGTIAEALNLAVSWLGGDEIRVKCRPNTLGVLEVEGLDLRTVEALGRAAQLARTPPHSHNVANTALYDEVSTRRLLEGLVYHKAGDPALTLRIVGFPYDQGRKYFPDSALNLLSPTDYRPTTLNMQAWVKVGVDQSTNLPVAARGAEYANTATLGYAELVAVALPEGSSALAGVRLTQGQTAAPTFSDFLDLRSGFGAPSAGIDSILTDENGDVLSDENGDVLWIEG